MTLRPTARKSSSKPWQTGKKNTRNFLRVQYGVAANRDIEARAALRLEVTPETARLSGMRINDRSRRKAQFGIKTTLEYCEQRIHAYLERRRTQGVDVPPLQQLEPM